jgi:hypothetical protein
LLFEKDEGFKEGQKEDVGLIWPRLVSGMKYKSTTAAECTVPAQLVEIITNGFAAH